MSTPRAEHAVFSEGPRRSWMVTALVHGALFGALALMARSPRAREVARATSVVEFDAPPPPPRAPPPEPPAPEVPPPPAAEPPRPRAVTPAPQRVPTPERPPAAPPPVMTAQGDGSARGDPVPSGTNTNFRGGETATNGVGDRGGRGDPAPPTLPPAPPEPVRRDGPVDLPDEASAPEPADDNAQPDYPEALRQSGVQGTVIARFVVREDGRVDDVRVLRGPEELRDTVREALRRWRFRPATLNGQPIAVYRTMPFRFVLENL